MNGACLVAIHEGRYYKRSDGQLALGPGAFVKGLEYSAGVKAEVVGKPTKQFFITALNGIDPQDAVMIGDVRYYSIIFITHVYFQAPMGNRSMKIEIIFIFKNLEKMSNVEDVKNICFS